MKKTLWFKLALIALFSVTYLTLPSSVARAGEGGGQSCSSGLDCNNAAPDACPGGARAICCCGGTCAFDCSGTATNHCSYQNCPGLED